MKALIAMSGGVDSSVAAKLTLDAGYECIGCTMKLWDAGDTPGAAAPDRFGEDAGEAAKTCCSLDDTLDARSVAVRLGMRFYAFNFKSEFERNVICPFVSAYEAGETPNPCIECNRALKFGKLIERAGVLGCDKVVTGHYARVERGADGRYVLKKALDPAKDQSYVLYMLGQRELERVMFPLGALSKSEVRQIAAENGFVNANKPESQDICFVPDGDYASFIGRRGVVSEPGEFVDTAGSVLGEHRGIVHYTVGQRKHLGIAMGRPVYVVAVDAANNRVVLGDEEELFSREALVRGFSWVSGEAPDATIRCAAKIRYRKAEQPATATVEADGAVRLTFDEPQRAICPGQAAVLYDGENVLGGGKIVASRR